MQPVRSLLLLAGMVAGITYLPAWWLLPHGPGMIVWKGAGVGFLACWAWISVYPGERGWITAILALGALGDVLIDAVGLTVGALAFLAGHIVATIFYLRHRRAVPFAALAPIAVARLVVIPVLAFLLPDDRSAAPGIALYATGLGAMAAAAYVSNFPAKRVSLGALMFAASDLLIFARLGPLHDSILPALLIWPLYFAGQGLIALGVVDTLRHAPASARSVAAS